MQHVDTTQWTTKTLRDLNQFRIHIQDITLSDITEENGQTISTKYLTGNHKYPSIYQWTQFTAPTKRMWKTWAEFLTYTFPTEDTEMTLITPLGHWTTSDPHCNHTLMLSLDRTTIKQHISPSTPKLYQSHNTQMTRRTFLFTSITNVPLIK